ncbi:hypothetical protein [Saccharothrix sp. ST-888]|nr:hypothetical protein [Saccharothrix sp. ST-888]
MHPEKAEGVDQYFQKAISMVDQGTDTPATEVRSSRIEIRSIRSPVAITA